MPNHTLSITNKEVFDFYSKYSLNFEQMNILFCNVLQQIITSTDTSFNNNIASQLFDKLTNIEQTIHKQQTDIATLFNAKFTDFRKEYLNDIKLILTSNNVEQLTPLIRDTTSTLIDKISIIINDLFPKTQESLVRDINANFKILQSSVLSETSKLITSTIDKHTIQDFLTNINLTMSQTHNMLTTIVSSSEARIETKLNSNDAKINDLKTYFIENQHSQQQLQNSVNEMLKKFEKGSTKGNVSEHVIYNILLSLFPCAQIDHVGNELKETGDIILIRTNKPKILIENKDHISCNVPRTDVDKFIRDCEIQNCCGIMFAQNRGIANKQNYEIQLNNGNVLLFVHEVNFDVDKIKTSIELVEQFKIKLDEINVTYDASAIDNETLEEINTDFSNYMTQKNAMIKMLKDFNDKMSLSINDLKMPGLEKYLSNHFATSTNQCDNICKYCEKFIPKSLLQHYRYCSSKKDYETKHNIVSTDSEINNLVVSIPSTQDNELTNAKKKKPRVNKPLTTV
jgi:hypothetical protein